MNDLSLALLIIGCISALAITLVLLNHYLPHIPEKIQNEFQLNTSADHHHDNNEQHDIHDYHPAAIHESRAIQYEDKKKHLEQQINTLRHVLDVRLQEYQK